jgi:hypothetical protein
VEIGGTESRTFRVRIVEKPTVTGIWRRYEYPEYARLEPKTEADSEGAISVLAGTAVQMKVTANKPIQSARMRLLGNPDRPEGTETNFIIEADRITLTLPTAFRVLQNGSYLVLLTDDLGNENTGSAPRKITALPDKPPEVTMAAPGKDLMMPPGSTLDLVARGTDDYGIASARLLAWREGSKDQETLKEWSGLTGKNCSLNWPWNLDAKKYKTGDVFRYQVKMWDNNNVTGPGIGASAEYQLRIEDVEATRQRAEEKYSNWRVLLQRALEEQKSLRKEASQLHP